ncbi:MULTISPECIES: glycosyltransferase [unclassified Kaistella]|uniref:glycosyltransferase family 2 protein n=1 Tax=unclassified Kaistella TaxID=2762626 RepID=UPI002732C01F|nr:MULTISPECIES: glycosyltransferase [unclassified Kaistella]MDP2454942.1 glycosyltransferase [Kaistella sp. SH11-4b]MDP2456075.1 glycosyltransferase [Kaistella sp. SH40-3]MDP2460612.1 glycosyltransferase [Kaistella sp. SH19-2b]
MKFSVLIAHYNNAKYFKECYQSLLEQTYKNWEAIILDDASEEVEKNLVKQIIEGDIRFKYYENAKNKGVGFTKSKLIELATGDIVGYVDPDDTILPTAIEKSIAAFQNDKKAVLTYSRFISCDENLKPISAFKSAQQVQNNDPYFFNIPVQIAHFVCFKKEVYLTTEKMNTELKISEDQDLYLKLYEKGKVVFINETNYLYRTHSGGISQNDHKKESYEYWAKVIWDAMQRRKLKTINGKKIPTEYTSSNEIFDLLQYQNSIPYRIKKKLKILFQSLF